MHTKLVYVKCSTIFCIGPTVYNVGFMEQAYVFVF